MLKKILVALDASSLSDQVLFMLQQLQVRQDARVILAHVVANAGADPDIAVDRPDAEIEDISNHYLDKLQDYQASLPCASEVEVVRGDPAEEIVRLANIHDVDLIIIGNRGLTGMNRILQGSVSSQVVVDAHCSVLVVKQG